MPTSQITLKHNKHLVHPCPKNKKLPLLEALIAKNSNLDIVVVSNDNLDILKEAIARDNILLTDDKNLQESDKAVYELLISYDLPSDASVYMKRLAKATKEAIIIIDNDEQKKLYPIETLLKRAIRQEVVVGFAYETKEAKKSFDKPKHIKSKRDGKKSDKFAKKDKKQNKFFGKDENTKEIFSGKSGDRNHHYDGTRKNKPKKAGRKIPIKLRDSKADSNSWELRVFLFLVLKSYHEVFVYKKPFPQKI